MHQVSTEVFICALLISDHNVSRKQSGGITLLRVVPPFFFYYLFMANSRSFTAIRVAPQANKYFPNPFM